MNPYDHDPGDFPLPPDFHKVSRLIWTAWFNNPPSNAPKGDHSAQLHQEEYCAGRASPTTKETSCDR